MIILFPDAIIRWFSTGSKIKIDNLIETIKIKKFVNIVIISVDVDGNSTNDLRKIVDAAYFGKLLRVGEKLEFKTVNDAFSVMKEIILKENNLDIIKTFNL